MPKTPVGIISFNRPKYLFDCCKALQPQCEERDVYFFQDGPFKDSHIKEIESNLEIFAYFFPSGIVHKQESNLGIGYHTKYARETLFEKYEAITTIEDDLVLCPWYMEMIDELEITFRDNEFVGMVNAFAGNTIRERNSINDQKNNIGKMCQMDHSLAPLVWRDKYSKIQNNLLGYYETIKNINYVNKDSIKTQILDYWRKKGVNRITISQDSAIVASMLLAGQVNISTSTNNLSYIGKVGVHGDPRAYDDYGFGRWPTYPEKTTNYNCSQEELKQIYKSMLAKYGI